jgi:hypothetical protein
MSQWIGVPPRSACLIVRVTRCIVQTVTADSVASRWFHSVSFTNPFTNRRTAHLKITDLSAVEADAPSEAPCNPQ